MWHKHSWQDRKRRLFFRTKRLLTVNVRRTAAEIIIINIRIPVFVQRYRCTLSLFFRFKQKSKAPCAYQTYFHYFTLTLRAPSALCRQMPVTFLVCNNSNERLCMRGTSCGYLAMKWKHNYTREVLLSLHFLSSSLFCAPLLSGGPGSYVNALRGSLSLCLSIFLGNSYSLFDTHTHTHTHTRRLTKLFVTIIVRAGLMRAKEIAGERIREYDGPPSPGERSNRLMVPRRSAQGRKVMTSYITAAASAISVVSISASFILPVRGEWYLTFQGFCKLFSQRFFFFFFFP